MSEFFLKIVNMSISASWLIPAVLILRILIKRAPKWITVLLWGIVAVRLICPVSIESAISLIPRAETINSEIITENTSVPDYDMPVISGEIDAEVPAASEGINQEIPVTSDGMKNDIGTSFDSDLGESTPVNPIKTAVTVLSAVWICGIAIMLTYSVISYFRIKSKIATAILLRDNIFHSESVVSPFVLGIIKPRIYLPWCMDGNSIEHVIAHENAHILRKDHLWKPIGFLILTLHWFNPLVWVGYVMLCRDIELACDEKVIKNFNTEQKADYSQALLTCSVNRRMITACPLAFGEVSVKGRVRSVLNYKKPTFWIIIIAIIASVAVAICFLTNPKTSEKDETDDKTVETSSDTRSDENDTGDEDTVATENTVPDKDTTPEETPSVDTIPPETAPLEETTPSEITPPETTTAPETTTPPETTVPAEAWEKRLAYSEYDAETNHYYLADNGEEILDENSCINHVSGTAAQSGNGDFVLSGENLNHLAWAVIGYNESYGGLYIGVSMNMYHMTADSGFINACDNAVTVSYDGSVVKDNTDAANQSFSITINGNRVTAKSVLMGKGNGHQDYYFVLDTDVTRTEIKEITFNWRA